MRILAIDTATEACSVALWNNGTINAHFELCPREHTNGPAHGAGDSAPAALVNEIDAGVWARAVRAALPARIGISLRKGC